MIEKPTLFYSIIGWVLLIAGFFVALYLSVSHYRVYTDIGYSSFCAISKSLNCDTVSQSGFSILFGMPVPVWGVLGYLFLLFMFPFLFQKKNSDKKLWTLFFVIVSFFSVYSLVLAFISNFYIHTYCLMCITLYAINLALFFYSYRVNRTIKDRGFLKRLQTDYTYIKSKASPLLLSIKLFFFVGIILWVFFPKYWVFEIKNEIVNLPSGVTEDGGHWVGAKDPEVTIIEFTDYLCFQCKKMHFYLRSLVAANPDKIRLVHRNFPLDREYNFALKENLHTGAGKMALLAIYAGMKDRFWEMNDLLFQVDLSKGTIDLNELAPKINLKPEELAWALDQTAIRLHLKRDIAMGVKAGVTGTPSYMINDQLYLGAIPSDLLTSFR
ncbi:MAG: thioredoxin domain-containing protein [Desulfobacula sp.]|nr:thioredoxin domain-containing protein [Desulfobacula sp.]